MNDISVQVEDDAVVNVDMDEPTEVEALEAKKEQPKTKRVFPDESTAQAVTGPSPEQALEEAKKYAKEQADARKAAEATAANERSLREQAQRNAEKYQKESEEYRELSANSELALVERGIAATQQEIDNYREAFTRASEAGDFNKLGEINEKLAKSAAKLGRLEDKKADFESGVRKVQTTEGRVEAQPVQQNMFENYISQFDYTAQNWLRMHPDCVPPQFGGDPVKHNKMMAGHHSAIAKSVAFNSPEYFKIIEETINPVVQVADPVDPVVTTTRKQAMPSAPPSRDSSPGNPGRNVKEVRLTRDEQEIARISWPNLSDKEAFGLYARNKLDLENEGMLGRKTH